MNPRRIATILLLLFVTVSVAVLIQKEAREAETKEEPAVQDTVSAPPAATNAVSARQTIAYYFHGDARCETCMKLESYTKETLERDFADRIKNGALVWKTTNVDRPENAHFIKEYGLTTRTVVLVKTVNGKPAEWQKLVETWGLVGNKEEFQKYIKTEASEFLKDEKK